LLKALSVYLLPTRGRKTTQLICNAKRDLITNMEESKKGLDIVRDFFTLCIFVGIFLALMEGIKNCYHFFAFLTHAPIPHQIGPFENPFIAQGTGKNKLLTYSNLFCSTGCN